MFAAWTCWLGEGDEDCGTSTGVVYGATSGSLASGWVSTGSFAEGPSGGAGPSCVDVGGVPVGLPRGATAEPEGGGDFSCRYAGLVEGCGLSSGRQGGESCVCSTSRLSGCCCARGPWTMGVLAAGCARLAYLSRLPSPDTGLVQVSLQQLLICPT